MTKKRRRVPLLGAALLGLSCAGGLVIVGCGEDGVTPDCPALTLYNVRVVYGDASTDASAEEIAELRAKIDEERRQAAEKGCLTVPGTVEPPPTP